MDHIGIDLHKRESQICIETDQGEVLEKRIRTERERFVAVFGQRPRAKILLEAMTEAEWVARCLEELGHEVIVADPNYAAMYASRSRRVKTDRRDAMTLADACRLGAYRPAHRASDRQRHVRAELAVRDTLVRTRVKCVALVGALTRRQGVHIPSGNVDGFVVRVEALELPQELQGEIAPLVALIRTVSAEVAAADARIAAIAAGDPVIQRLRTVPGVGPVTATAFVATLDTWERFSGPHQVEAYLGLVPSERVRGRSSTRDGSPRRGTAGRAGCWWRRRGRSSARHGMTPSRCGVGRSAWPCGAGPSRGSWRWRASWPGSSMRCGGTGVPTRNAKGGRPRGRPRHRGQTQEDSQPGSNTGER